MAIPDYRSLAASPPGDLPRRPGREMTSSPGIRIDRLRQQIEWEGSTVHLSPREMAAMIALASAAGAPVASGDLARRIWPGSALVSSYDVRRIIYQLRSSLRANRMPFTIRNVRGWGYSLERSGSS